MAERAQAREVVEIEGASHTVGVSHPEEVADVSSARSRLSSSATSARLLFFLRQRSMSVVHGLFTEVRERFILGSWYAGCRIAPLAGHPMVGLRLSAPKGRELYVARGIKMRSGGCVAFSQDAETGRGSRSFDPGLLLTQVVPYPNKQYPPDPKAA